MTQTKKYLNLRYINKVLAKTQANSQIDIALPALVEYIKQREYNYSGDKDYFNLLDCVSSKDKEFIVNKAYSVSQIDLDNFCDKFAYQMQNSGGELFINKHSKLGKRITVELEKLNISIPKLEPLLRKTELKIKDFLFKHIYG